MTTSQLIYMYAGNGCGDDESSFYVNISDIDTTLSLDNGVLTAQQPGAVYQWWNCNDNTAPIEGEAGQAFMPSESGDYSVFITLGDCESWSDCVYVTALSLSENQTEKLSFYPNPVTATLNINNPENVNINKILITDLSGKIVMEDGAAALLNLEKLAGGMYILQVHSDGKVVTKKLIKQ